MIRLRTVSASREASDTTLMPKSWKPRSVAATLTVIVFLVQYGLAVSDIPSQMIIQRFVCSSYFGVADAEDLPLDMCQIEGVVEQVNNVMLVMTATSAIPAILTALLYGNLSDTWGRKRVFLSSVFGMMLFQAWTLSIARNVPQVSIYAMASAGIAYFVGGGFSTAEAMVFSMISDVADNKWRTTFFQIAICSDLVAQIVGSLTGQVLLSVSIWTPLYLGLAFNALGLLLILILPETLRMRKTEDRVDPNHSGTSGEPRSLKEQAVEIVKAAGVFLWKRRISLLVPLAALTLPLSTASLSQLTRVIPARYGNSYSTSAAMVAIRSATTVFLLAVIMPFISCLWHQNVPFQRDYKLAKVFSMVLPVGMVIIGSSSTIGGVEAGMVLFTLGSAVPGLVRSIMAQIIEKGHLGALFGLLAVYEQTGNLILGLIDGGLLVAALRKGGGRWYGLTYYFTAALFVVCIVCLWLARPVPRKDFDTEMNDVEGGSDQAQSDTTGKQQSDAEVSKG